ncbi:MAG: DUF938 domain-containing protein [Alphaproteobacteria bacterium]
MTADQRLDFAATGRNAQVIADVLLPQFCGRPVQILEVASGSGQHGVFMTSALPHVTWWPTDIDPDHLASIDAWTQHSGTGSVMPASRVNVTDAAWRSGEEMNGWPQKFDAVFNANMIHITPWEVALGLIEGAARRLAPDGFLFLYGPFQRDGRHTAQSNQAFHESLVARNPAWGVRDIAQVRMAAEIVGLALEHEVEMPANNLSLIFRLAGGPDKITA